MALFINVGYHFKENCPDVRNTKVINVIEALVDYGITITTHDPVADPDAVLKEYGITTCTVLPSARMMQWFWECHTRHFYLSILPYKTFEYIV
jgi:UDP-N-acetyl-D-mannosaminuronate dehydrogenase